MISLSRTHSDDTSLLFPNTNPTHLPTHSESPKNSCNYVILFEVESCCYIKHARSRVALFCVIEHSVAVRMDRRVVPRLCSIPKVTQLSVQHYLELVVERFRPPSVSSDLWWRPRLSCRQFHEHSNMGVTIKFYGFFPDNVARGIEIRDVKAKTLLAVKNVCCAHTSWQSSDFTIYNNLWIPINNVQVCFYGRTCGTSVMWRN